MFYWRFLHLFAHAKLQRWKAVLILAADNLYQLQIMFYGLKIELGFLTVSVPHL